MAFKGFFKSLANEGLNELGRQIEKKLNPGEAGGSGGGESSGGFGGGKIDMNLVKGVLGLLSGGGAGGAGTGGGGGIGQLTTILNAVQGQMGGYLPGNVAKYLPSILKLAEIIGHGMGDDSPRTERNSDGSFIDNFIKTIIGGRKIHGGGKAAAKVKPIVRGGGHVPGVDYDQYDGSGEAGFQDYEQIRAQCLADGVLFEDPEFPAEESSVFFSSEGRRSFEWLRPHEICSDPPSFFVEGASRFDVKQGELGDCWLLAALANLTLNEHIFAQVVPQDNSFDEGYAGIFHFRFWQYGRWVDVVVDDRLPTKGGRLMFLHSEDNNEFWSALLEKAYAKLHGSYEALKGGTTCEALEDFTGGVTEMYDLKTAPKNLLDMIQKAFERSSFLGCSIEPDPKITEAETSMGLIRGHAYSITDVKLLDIETPRVRGKVPLLRIKNPWGNEAEWKGGWGDGSKEWSYIDDETKEEIGLHMGNSLY
ncbi:Calpain-A [Folsomia candida]|uniref:Calpain-A n=1 Tax=Folsomia candida TaxID=158441 RepID=A0A226E0H0_FOLCA|nr:Calpain-A [Folsomia candida]